jgi:hypothetical protein
MKELYFIENKDTKHIIGRFSCEEDIRLFYKHIYDIVTLNPNQHLLILKSFNKEQVVESSALVGVYRTITEVETGLNGMHEICDLVDSDGDDVDLKQMIKEKIEQLENEIPNEK